MATRVSSSSRPAKKKRNRKARTEVSSSSSSSENSSSDSDAAPPAKTVKSSKPALTATEPAGDADIGSPSPSPAPLSSAAPKQTSEQVFQAFYLKQATREFSDDLERLRTANDWKGERSVDVLVRALGQGVDTFTPDEMVAIASGRQGADRMKQTDSGLKD
ncbi:hypothetical protein B0A48_06792 [Cryoendolithus antarcticus]|uniref:Ribosome assembly protein 3 n=1 Tax=Cryoendolithus antarcticus TaxID=1507870 RepID=A0A1V8T9H3_9PEZI|nr:hypothetical protein B0A48_06792 [Cryoendolithus antarcticus]